MGFKIELSNPWLNLNIPLLTFSKHSFSVSAYKFELNCFSKWISLSVTECGVVKPGQICCVPIDRAVHRVYGCPIFFDRCPTLTTRNWYLFVFSVEDLDKVDRLRRIFRYLTPLERLRLQGCPDSDRNSLSFVAARHAAGNAFSSCAMAAELGPLIDAIGGMPAGSLLAWPPPGLASGVVGPSAMNFLSGDIGGSDRRVISRR